MKISKKLRNEEKKSPPFLTNPKKASTEELIRALASSGRGYDMSDADLEELFRTSENKNAALRFHQNEGCLRVKASGN